MCCGLGKAREPQALGLAKMNWKGWSDGSAVRALVALAEDPGLVLSTHVVAHDSGSHGSSPSDLWAGRGHQA